MNKEEKQLVPEVRFPEFEGEWNEKILEKLCFKISDGLHSTPKYDDLGEYYFVNGNNLINGVIIINESTKRVSKEEFEKHKRELGSNTILLSINGTIGNLSEYNDEKVVLGKSACYINVNEDKVDKKFIFYSLKTESIRSYFNSELTGSTIKNLSLKTIKNASIKFPNSEEQQKIVNCLSSLDTLITAETAKLENLKDHKKGLLQQLFPANGETKPQFRFPGFEDDGDWEVTTLGDCLDYLQPTPYLVSSTAYENKFETPVLTAGKTFILGYTNEKEGIFNKKLPVIIFDDFTTATKFVDFPFKAKSSAMKILMAKADNNIQFLFETIQNLNFEVSTHKRHWISVYSKLDILTPKDPKEQQKIADLFSSADELLEAQKIKIKALKKHKKGLMQQLFPNIIELL